MSTLVLDAYDRYFDLEKVHKGTCLKIDGGDWFIFRIPDGWIDDLGDSWSSEKLAEHLEGDEFPHWVERLN